MEAKGKSTAVAARSAPRLRRLRLWFLGGFLLVFVGMLLLVNITAMHPSGQYAVRRPLWQYYADDLRGQFRPTTLGPASGNTSTLLEIGLLHLLFSTVGGGALAAVGWSVRRLRRRTDAEPGAAADRGR